jgi:hypothetical protein
MLDWDSDQNVPTLPQISSSLIAAQLISVQIMRLFSCRAWGAEKLLGTSGNGYGGSVAAIGLGIFGDGIATQAVG